VEQSSPAPRLELFGRRPADGWTVWGNEIARSALGFDDDVMALVEENT
jgi:N6-adenosine-specific RNA methylase IME4